LGTSHYPPNITATYNFTPGHFQLPTHFHHHFQFHTWAPPITPPLSPSLPISQLGTSHYPPNFATTPNFTPGHIQLPIHFPHHLPFHTWAPPITVHFPHHFRFHTWGPPITLPISPPLTISHLATTDYPPTFTTTFNFTPGHLQLSSHFPHHFQFHNWAPPLPTQLCHHSQFLTWAHPITPPPPLSPLLPISHLDTCHYPPNFTSTPNFTPGHS
jgi:hypothetical protein